jgi:tripartite-type tricarboxylate transporter receptor subunit TctC
VTAARRSSLLPDMPTVAEAGVPGYEASGWFGVLVPSGTPHGVVERLNTAIVKGLAMNDARERLATLGGEVGGGPPEHFSAHIRSEAAKWSKLINALGLKGEQG